MLPAAAASIQRPLRRSNMLHSPAGPHSMECQEHGPEYCTVPCLMCYVPYATGYVSCLASARTPQQNSTGQVPFWYKVYGHCGLKQLISRTGLPASKTFLVQGVRALWSFAFDFAR
eukprot:102183-Rhodomonas_salina.1